MFDKIVLFYFLSEKIVVHEKDIWFFFAVPFFLVTLFCSNWKVKLGMINWSPLKWKLGLITSILGSELADISHASQTDFVFFVAEN